jgi:hypothetical protein
MARSKPQPIPFSLSACFAFWHALWAAPLRSALGDACPDPFPCSDALPRWPVLRALGPLWLQRQVAAAVLKRLAWQQQTGWRIVWQYEILITSIGWEAIANDGIALETRQEMDEPFLRWLFGLQLEMLLRLLAGRGPFSDELALRAVVGSCWRVSLLYRELCRRYKHAQARVIVEEELRCFLGHLAQRSTG